MEGTALLYVPPPGQGNEGDLLVLYILHGHEDLSKMAY